MNLQADSVGVETTRPDPCVPRNQMVAFGS